MSSVTSSHGFSHPKIIMYIQKSSVLLHLNHPFRMIQSYHNLKTPRATTALTASTNNFCATICIKPLLHSCNIHTYHVWVYMDTCICEPGICEQVTNNSNLLILYEWSTSSTTWLDVSVPRHSITARETISISQCFSNASFLKIHLFIHVWCVFHLNVYVCAPWACIAHEGQKSVLDLLELELHVIASCHVGSGNWT